MLRNGWLVAILVVAGFLWWTQPWQGKGAAPSGGPAAESRPVAARGTLAEDEQNNISVFKSVSPSTVHITTLAAQRSFLSLDVRQVPRGTGSGFLWDDR